MTQFDIKDATAENIEDCYLVRPRVKKQEPGYFERCLSEQEDGKRQLYLAYQGDMPVGYVHLIWTPKYLPFVKQAMPEIQDLYVAHDGRQQGAGRALVAHCEEAARQAEKEHIGIGVGLYRDYGAAQRLYVQMGYVPDGAGIVYDNEQVSPGEMRAVDDFLCLKLVKSLS